MSLTLNINSWEPVITRAAPRPLAPSHTTTPSAATEPYSATVPSSATEPSAGRVSSGDLWILSTGIDAPEHQVLCSIENSSACHTLCSTTTIPLRHTDRWWIDASRSSRVPANWAGYWPGWEPVRAALAGELARAGWTIEDAVRITRDERASSWFEAREWCFIHQEAYESLARAGAALGVFSPPYSALVEVHARFATEYVIDSAFVEPLLVGVLAPGETLLDTSDAAPASILAAEKTGRRCFAVNPMPAICERVVSEWETLTGRAAEKA